MSSESEPPAPKPLSAREKIIAVAGPLFYREGYRAVGVDRLIAEADVAKATFYKHFPSKDDLIVAWIDHAEAQSRTGLPPADGPAPFFAYADRMIDIATKVWCLGCTYQGSAAEFQDPQHPAHRAAIGVKRRVIEELESRARAQGLPDAKGAAERVFVYLEGVWASVRMFGADAPLAKAGDAIRRLAA
jgi:AcrR family transcriptional regulator